MWEHNAEEFDNFVMASTMESLTTKPMSGIILNLATEGSRPYPNMARVARVLPAITASSAVLKRDVFTTGRMITGSRSRMDSICRDRADSARQQGLHPRRNSYPGAGCGSRGTTQPAEKPSGGCQHTVFRLAGEGEAG